MTLFWCWPFQASLEKEPRQRLSHCNPVRKDGIFRGFCDVGESGDTRRSNTQLELHLRPRECESDELGGECGFQARLSAGSGVGEGGPGVGAQRQKREGVRNSPLLQHDSRHRKDPTLTPVDAQGGEPQPQGQNSHSRRRDHLHAALSLSQQPRLRPPKVISITLPDFSYFATNAKKPPQYKFWIQFNNFLFFDSIYTF